MFKVGDIVECVRPANSNMERYLGLTATVLSVTSHEGLYLSEPFWSESIYTPEQFILYQPVQENE